mmetsp:Transcript_20945/g.37100  ORF Transcript_20945/g.37100 Transcript_20945/m.37100 type:complete len:851 (+) Transcript_20945:172-2724(+)
MANAGGREGAGEPETDRSLLNELAGQDQFLTMLEKLIKDDSSDVLIPQLLDILKHEDDEAHYGVYIDAKLLLDDDMLLGHLVLRYPDVLLKLFSRALASQQESLLREPYVVQMIERGMDLSYKPNVHARVNWLPGACRKLNISSIRSIDVNTFIQLSGTVTRSSAVRVLEAIRVFECNNDKCNGIIRVFASKYEVGNMVEKPTGPCPTCKRCSSYLEIKADHVCHDYQEIKVQEQVQKLGMGSIPRSITVLLLHDLVDKCKAGDDVVITGVPIHRWSATYTDERCNLETVIDCNTVGVINASSQGVNLNDEMEKSFERFWKHWVDQAEPMRGRDLIVSSVCPQLYGLATPKLAVALALVGCPAFIDRSGTRVRGEPHLLLVGDPGTGKSQLIRYAAKLAPRSVLTTGTGITSAGLTCSAVKEGHEFMLEAGALVLADRGVCCIDEFGSIRTHDRATIHEAMEQQTLSVAKAGLVCTLNTRTTIIAACNPKGKFDPDADLSTNTGIAGPLLSRFDMALVLLDKSDEEWDRTVSEFILKAQAGLAQENSPEELHGDSQSSGNDPTVESQHGGNSILRGPWSVDTMQAYLAYVKRLEPELTTEAASVITAYYKVQRGREDSESGRTTLRLLESLIRISKAHARLMARKDVAIVDAVVSVQVVEMSLAASVENDTITRESFPSDPDMETWEATQGVLRELGLPHLIPLAEDQVQRAFLPTQADSRPRQSQRSSLGPASQSQEAVKDDYDELLEDLRSTGEDASQVYADAQVERKEATGGSRPLQEHLDGSLVSYRDSTGQQDRGPLNFPPASQNIQRMKKAKTSTTGTQQPPMTIPEEPSSSKYDGLLSSDDEI